MKMIFVALYGNIISGKDYWHGAVRELSLTAICATSVYFYQEAFYKKVLPYFSSIKSKEFRKELIYFMFINLFGAVGGYFILLLSMFSYSYDNLGFRGE